MTTHKLSLGVLAGLVVLLALCIWQVSQESTPPHADALGFLVTSGATKWQYTNGVRDKETISPDNWHVTQRLLDRPGNDAIQLQLFYDYGSNPPLYSSWQAYFRKHQPRTLIVWGTKDEIFPVVGAHPCKRDLKNLEFHLFDTGHFALEEDGEKIAQLIREFLGKTGDPRRERRADGALVRN
jgi:pimeloyl-ACP methyl ester carboxylesterase